jgi:nicotinic acid mononucleotide adenylyltransferase
MLTTDEPNVEFTLALGADTFVDLVNGKWRRSEDVLKLVEYRIVVFRRLIEEDNDFDDALSSAKEIEQYDEVRKCENESNTILLVTTCPCSAINN